VLDADSLTGVTNLTVRRGAIAVIDFSNSSAINLAGNLTNRGTVYVANADPQQLTATLAGSNIYNNARALITTVLPAGGVAGFGATALPLNLNLRTINDIVNAGTIASSGNLTMSAGGSIINALPQGTTGVQPVIQAAGNVNLFSGSGNITNLGLIASLNNNINIAALTMAANINVFGAGGTLQALNGNINLRDSSYSGPANINLTGGDYLSQALNLYSGTGTANVSVGQLAGLVNTYAGAEHISADTTLLKLGNNISNDPTYYNTGSIEIMGTVSSDEGLAIVAGGDITANINGRIVTNGHNLLMIAGANITSSCTGCTSPGQVGPTSGGTTPTSGVAEGTVTVDLTGGAGGDIDLSGSLAEKVIDTSSSTSSGGNVTMVALADGFGLEGTVALNTLCLLGSCAGEINTSGGGAGGGGNVTIYAGASSLLPVTSISTNKIETISNGTLNSGSVTLETTQAVTSDLQPLVLDAHGAITSGNTIQPGTPSMAGISTGSIDTEVKGGSQKAGDVIITAYGDIDASAGTVATLNNGVGAAGEVIITSSNGSVSTGEIASFVYSGWLAAANVTISAYGDITTNGNFIYAFQGGSGAGGTITLTSSNGSVSTGVLVIGVGDTVAGGNVIISAYDNITTSVIAAFNAGTGGGGSVNLTSSNGAITTGEILTYTLLGLVPAGNVTISAYGDITVLGQIDASNAGISAGGSVTLLTQDSLTTGDINTSSTGLRGGSITAAAAGDNGTYSIALGNLNTSGTAAAGSVEVVSTDLLEKPNLIGAITAKASGQSGVGGSVGIATRGGLAVGKIDTTNTSASASSGAQSGSVFLSSGSTATDAILAGDINAYNSANGSATGQVILIASGTIGVLGTITTSAGNSSVNPSYTSLTSSISSSTTIDVSVTGISGLFSNYNPQGYLFMSGGSTQLTIDSGGNSSLLAPLLCLTTVSIDSIKSNSGTNADGVALVAGGDITLGGAVGVNTAATTSGGNVNLLSITGLVSVGSLSTNSSGAGAAGSVSVSASEAVTVGGTIDTSNSGAGAGGTVTLISSRSYVSVGEIDTHVSGGAGAAGQLNISAYGDVSTSGNAIKVFNAGTGTGGTVFLVSSTGSVSVGAIDTYASSGTAAAGNVVMAAYGDIDTNSNAIAAYNAGSGLSGNVILISSNSSITAGAIDAYVASGSEKAADVTVSAYGAINLTGALNAANTGSGSGSTVNLLSANGSVTTGGINVNVGIASIVAGNVNIEASGAIDTSAGTIQAKNGGTRPIDSGVYLLSHTNSINTGEIDISVDFGSAALAGNVSISAPLSVTVGAKIDASNNGSGGGGTVTLASSGSSVEVSEVDTYVKSSSQTAGSVSILADGLIKVDGIIDASNGVIAASGVGTAGTVTLLSASDKVTTGDINTNVHGGSATAGNVTILADKEIKIGVIDASNAGIGAGGEIALTSASTAGFVESDGIKTYVSGGSAAAGNVIISAPDHIAISGAIITNNTSSGAGGSIALISNGAISLSTITTSGAPGGSVFLSSGDTFAGAITTGAITLGGGALLATAAKSGSITVQLFADGNTLSVDDGQIFATGTYTSAVDILPLAFTNSATTTITPAIIPGGGFTSFSNSGTVTLASDAGSSGNVITFSDLVPVFVQSTVSSLGTINDSTSQANFFVLAPTVAVSSSTAYTSTTGSLSIVANQMSMGDINTNGANLNLTAVQAITTGVINTSNSYGTVSGHAKLLSVIGSVTTEAIDTYITSGSAAAGNVVISAYGTISTNEQAINAYNSGTGTGGTINLTISGAGSVEIGEIKTSINNASSNAAAGSITILAAAAIDTNQKTIDASNLGTGAGGTVTLTSETFSITTSDIDTHVASGSVPAGNVFISALQSIIAGNINASNAGTGAGGSVTLVRAAAMKTADVDTSSTGSAGGAIIAASVGDNNDYTLEMGNLKTSGFTAAGSIMLVGDDFGARPLTVGNITAQASGPNGVGGSVGISGLGTVTVGSIDTTNTAAVVSSGAQSGSVFLSSGSTASGAIHAGTINAYNPANGSATGQVILIASGTITTTGAITTSAGTIPANTFTSNLVSGSEASITPSYTSNTLSITSSTTVDVSVTGISGPSSNYNPHGYAALSGSDTVLTIDGGGNSLLLAPLVFTAFVPMAIKSINSSSHTAADSIALVVFGNLTLSDAVGINAAGTTSGGSVTLQSSAGQISITSIATNSSGSGAAGSINISAWAAIPVTGTINASNSGTGAGGTVFLASTDNSVATGGIDTSVASGSAAAGNVTIATYGAMSTNAINASNSGAGAGATVLLTSSNSSVTTGEIKTGGSESAGNVFISAYGAVNTNGNTIQTYNTDTGAGAVSLTSTNNSVSTGDIDTYVTTGSGAAGNLTISALGSITLGGNIATYNTGSGAAGTVTLRAVGNIQTTSTTVKVESPSITLTSVKGNIQSVNDSTPLLIQSGLTSGTLSLIAHGGGSVLLADTLVNDNVQFNNTLPVNVSTAGTLFSLKTAGNITQQATTTAVTSAAIVLETTAGDIGESGDALQTSSTDTMSITAGGNAYINQTGAFTLLDSHAGGNFQLNSSGSTTINSLASQTGSLSVIVGYFGSTLNVAAGSQVTSGNGNLLLENDNTASGSIVIGANANLTSGNGQVNIVIGPVPFTPVLGPKPANVKVTLASGGQVFFGASGINALSPTNFVNANGNNVIFNTGSFSSSAIQLGGNVTINAGNAPVLFNLDLTNPQTVAAIQAAQAANTIGGTLIVSGGIAVGGDIVLKPINLSGTLSALNIPANVTVTNKGFSAANPLTINLTETSTTTQVVINGKNLYKGSNTNAALNINSTFGGTVFVEGASGTLSSQGPLTISANGNMTFDGMVSGNNIALNTTSASNGNLSLGGIIGAATTSSVTLSTDGTGTVTQTGGTIAGKNIEASSGTGNIILSNIGSGANVSASTGGAAIVSITTLGSLSVQNSSAGGTFTVNSGSALTLAGDVSAVSVTLIAGSSLKQNSSATNILASTVTIAAGKGDIGSSNTPIQITASNLSITSINRSKAFINNTGALTIDNTTVGRNLTLTSSAGLTIGNVSTISGSLNLQTAAGALTVIAGDSVSANSGNLFLQNLNTASGTIDIGANATLAASGSGNVTVLIGSTPAPKTNTTTPANVTPIISGNGKIFYGASSIVAGTPTNTITATGRTVIFSGPASAISLDGGVTIDATQVNYSPTPNDNCDEIVDTGDDGEDLDVDDRLLVNSSQ
jgi:hypothetical protein